jgi:hypothetical protein
MNKKCQKCKIYLVNVHPNTKYCDKCRPIVKKEQFKHFYYKDLEKSRKDNREKQVKARQKDPEKFKNRQKRFRDENPEKIQQYNRNRYKKIAPKYRCVICGKSLFLTGKIKYCQKCKKQIERERSTTRYEEITKKLNQLKVFVGCERCGYKDHRALEFHHVNPKSKSKNIAHLRSLTAVKSEIPKCIILCANCHIKEHLLLKQKSEQLTSVQKRRQKLINIKSQMGCGGCGYKDGNILQFHHIYPKDKEYNITGYLSIAKTLYEILKCEILCANCHRLTPTLGDQS